MLPVSVEVKRLKAAEAVTAVSAVRLLKTPDGYPLPSVEAMSRFLSRPENVLIIATMGDLPVGYIVAYLLDRVDRDQQMMFFYEIGVGERYRRRGIGKRLVHELKAICRAHHVMKMWVPTSRSNLAATTLYASTGGVPLPNDDEVTYAYSRDTFMHGEE